MATPPNLTQIAFGASLDESTEDEVLDPTVGFPVSINTRQDRRGGVSKRLGFSSTSSARLDGSPRTAGRRLLNHRNVTCVIDGATLDVYSGQFGSVPCGRVPEASVETRPLSAAVTTDARIQYDAVVCNGLLIVVYGTTTNGAFALVSTIDENIPIGTFHVSGSVDPIFQIGSVGSTAILVTSTYSGGTLFYSTLDCTSAATVALGWAGPTSFATGVSGKLPSTLSLSLESLSDRIAIAYVNNSGGSANRVSVISLDIAGIVESRTVDTAHAIPDTVAVAGTIADTLWVAWNQATALRVIGLDGASLFSTRASSATVATGGIFAQTNPPSITLGSMGAASIVALTGDLVHTRSWTTVAGAVTPDAGEIDFFGAVPASRAFVRAGRQYSLFAVGADVLLGDYTNTPTTQVVRPVAYAYPHLAATDPSSHVVTLPDGRLAYVVAVITAASVDSYVLVIYDFANPTRWRSASHNGVTFLSGGILSYFSSDRVQEAAFLHPPLNVDANDDGGGTGPTGDVSYVAVFEAVDGAGNLSTSGASLPFAHTGIGNQVLLSVDPLLMTARGAVKVTFYRTTPGSSIYRKVSSADALASPSAASSIDTYTNDDLTSHASLYGTGALPGSNGSALQRDAPPYCRDVVSYAGMLVIASGSDLWWSGQTVGGEGTWFSTEQFFLTVDGPGDITALAVQDGTLYVFKERSIYVVSGDIPADNGSSGGLGQPRLLSSDVGCINTNSLVETSLGVFFQSHRGIELLGRGSPNWIGEKVQRTLERYPIVTSAVLDARNNIIRFSLAAAFDTNGSVVPYDAETSTSGGRDLVYDLVLGDWQSVDDKTGSTEHQASQDACVITANGESKYAWLAADGTVYVENDSSDANAYRENNGTWITMSVETGWFKVAGIQGRQMFNRVLLLARKRSATNLSLAIGYNYGLDFATARTWTNDSLDSLLTNGWPITQLQHSGNNDSEGQSVRVRITDADPNLDGPNSGRGATWLALTLDSTPRSGATDVPEEAS